MTDITDQELRDARQWADELSSHPFLNENARAAVRYILDTVDATTPTLAEELARIAENSPVWTIQNVCDELKSAAARAEQIEHDLAEARAERDRLQAQVQGLVRRDGDHNSEVRMLTEERDEALAEVERLTAERQEETMRRVNEQYDDLPVRDRDWLDKDGLPDPADVKPGEAWIVECRGERRAAVKDMDDNNVPWNTVNADGWCLPEDNEDVTLLHRLVPAPRVITNTDELAALPHRTVIRDNAGVMFQRIVHGWYQAGDTSVHRSDDNFVCLPVTVLWEPEA